MKTNFEFLKKVDESLFEIIIEAEKLYRDEYFEQCMTQTRRFGEHVCKNMLTKERLTTGTFDDMLATLKDRAKSFQEKEFIEDLYFLKRQGNNSVHSLTIHKDGMQALECLQRAFEVAISYTIHQNKATKTILKRRYDTELLLTGEKSKNKLTEKYLEEKSKQNTRETNSKPTKKSTASKKPVKQSYKMKSSKEKTHSVFKALLIVSSIISATIVLMLLVL